MPVTIFEYIIYVIIICIGHLLRKKISNISWEVIIDSWYDIITTAIIIYACMYLSIQ
jgi:hypothetical protein